MMKEVYYRAMLTGDDLLFTPLYFLLIIVAAYFIRNIILPPESPLRKYFIPGLAVKLVGGIMVGLIYFYYYGAGDTVQYFNNARVIYNAFNDSPYYFYRLMLAGPNFDDPSITTYAFWMYYHRDPSAWFFAKICGFLSVFAFGTYTPIALLLAFISFTGAWSLLVTLYKIYPQLHREFAIAVLFIPSVFFWGSGILKDSITFACVGWMTYYTYNIFFERRKLLWSAFMFTLVTYVCLELKAYIVFSMLPALVFWVMLHYRKRVQSGTLQFLLGPVAVVCAAVFGFLIINRLGQEYTTYSLSGAVKTAQGFHEWHDWLAQNADASGYSLGKIDGSLTSIVLAIPAAANVTLFRPYPWEVRNPVMLLSALESFAMLLFTLGIFWRTGIGNTFKSLGRNPTAFFCMFFAIFFAFAVGFTAYNFGALVRYKIPCIPFFVAGLYILRMQTVEDKKARLAKKQRALKPSFA